MGKVSLAECQINLLSKKGKGREPVFHILLMVLQRMNKAKRGELADKFLFFSLKGAEDRIELQKIKSYNSDEKKPAEGASRVETEAESWCRMCLWLVPVQYISPSPVVL